MPFNHTFPFSHYFISLRISSFSVPARAQHQICEAWKSVLDKARLWAVCGDFVEYFRSARKISCRNHTLPATSSLLRCSDTGKGVTGRVYAEDGLRVPFRSHGKKERKTFERQRNLQGTDGRLYQKCVSLRAVFRTSSRLYISEWEPDSAAPLGWTVAGRLSVSPIGRPLRKVVYGVILPPGQRRRTWGHQSQQIGIA